MFIFLDESGDLGFDFTKRKTTRKFAITLLVCYSDSSRKEIKKAVRRTLKNKISRKKKGKKTTRELKGTSTTLHVKKYFYRNIESDDWSLYTLVLDKTQVASRLRTRAGKKRLYNFLSRFLVEKLEASAIKQDIELVVDRSKNKDEVREFNDYLLNQLEGLLPLDASVYISHLASGESAELQAVDMFSWGIFRKYEKDDMAWYDVFKDKINFETEYLRQAEK